MPKLVFLGTSNAIPHQNHENTHMAIIGRQQTIMIDCVSNSLLRLEKAGIDYNDVTDIILTHFHPDHVSGVPLLLMSMWLLGRKRSLNIYGLSYTLERMERLMEFYDWGTWPNFFPVNFLSCPSEEMTPVLNNSEVRISASPVHHLIPNIGLRIEALDTGKVIAYSCDTEPCQEVVRLADGADYLIHEAAGATLGHTSPAQAGGIAKKSEVRFLYLIHYPTRNIRLQSLVEEARTTFDGEVALAKDFYTIDF